MCEIANVMPLAVPAGGKKAGRAAVVLLYVHTPSEPGTLVIVATVPKPTKEP